MFVTLVVAPRVLCVNGDHLGIYKISLPPPSLYLPLSLSLFSLTPPPPSLLSFTVTGEATQEIIEGRGEGMILRKMNSLYLPGRNLALIKFKVFPSPICATFLSCFYFIFI